MADVTVRQLEEFESVFGGVTRRVRAGLGVTAFGMQVIEMPPDFTGYPVHDHSHDQQEEVYTPLSGSATLQIGDEKFELEPGMFARVGPGEKRKLISGPEGASILCVGGIPGQAYEAPGWSDESGPPTSG